MAGNYKILSTLGEGGMGTVYKAVDVMLEREVAIKMLRPEIASQPQIVERFRSEAITLAKLNHPSIATLYSFFRQGDQFFMVMEYVDGPTLDGVIHQGALRADRAVAILCQALDGIAHAHSLGILHRDLKPANIMLPKSGGVKVMDFGIARLLSAARMTRTGGLVGTLEYVAPERVRGQEADLRSDLYSMGIVLYEMLSGRVPFQSDTEYELMRAQLEQDPPALASLGVATPPGVEAALLKALAKHPEQRFASAAEFRAALLGASAPAPVSAAAVPKPTRLAGPPPGKETRLAEAPAAAAPAAFVPASMPAAAPRRKPDWKLYGGAAAAVVVLGLGAAFWAFRKPAPQPAPVPAAQTVPAPAPSAQPLASNAPTGGSEVLPGGSPLTPPDLQPPPSRSNPVRDLPSVSEITPPTESPAKPGASPANKRPPAAEQASVPAGPPLSLPDVLHLLINQTSSQVASAVERRGVNFRMSPSASTAIQNAGGNHALVAAISTRYAGGAAAPDAAAPSAPAATQTAASQSSPVVPAPQPQIPAVQPPPPTRPVVPQRAGVASLLDVRTLYIAPMADGLNLYIASEIVRQLGGRIQVVATVDRADAIMAGTAAQRSGATSMPGRVIGVQNDADASVVVTDRSGTRVLWHDEAKSRSVLGGVIRKGGPQKLAEHLIADMKRVLR